MMPAIATRKEVIEQIKYLEKDDPGMYSEPEQRIRSDAQRLGAQLALEELLAFIDMD